MVKKKNRNVIILVVILLVTFLFLNSYFQFVPLSTTGVSTLSLSQASLKSSNPYLDGEVWMITFAQGTLGQSYFGSFSPQQVQDVTPDGTTTEQTFSISVDFENQVCNYDITGTSGIQPIYDIERIEWAYVPFINPCSEEEAKERGLSNVLWFGRYELFSGGQLIGDCFAIGYNTKNPVGRLESPDVSSQYEISINAGGKSASKTLNTLDGSGQGQLGDFAYVNWVGNLETGKSCPDKDPYIPIYVNGIWRIGDRIAYDDYRSLLNTQPPLDREQQTNNWLNPLKNKIALAKQIKSFGTLESSTSLSDARVKVTQSSPVQFPVTTLYIEAETIGIFTPTPEIRLFSPNSDCFKTGESGSISIGLENVGEESGTWNVYAECDSPFTATRNVLVSLEPGESVSRLIPISASATQETTGQCTIFAESPAGIKTATVGVCVKPQITCNPNQKFCAVSGTDEVVKQCSSDGATSQIIDTCVADAEYCEAGECKVGTKPPEEGFFSRLFARISNAIKQFFSFTGDVIFVIKVIVLGVVLLFSLFFTKDILVKSPTVRKRKYLSWVLSILITGIIGLIISFIFFTFLFWLGIAAIIGYLIITKFFIK